MHLAGFDVDQVAHAQHVLHAVHDDIHLALQDEEVLLHNVVVVGLEVLAGAEADQGKVHPGALHEIFGAALAEAVFPLIFVDDKHTISPPIQKLAKGSQAGGDPHVPGYALTA